LHLAAIGSYFQGVPSFAKETVLSWAFVVFLPTAVAHAAPEVLGEFTGGFRMQSDPKIETVFGDTEQFKRYVDRFFVVHGEMHKTRETFSRHVQAVLAALGAAGPRTPGARTCPVEAVALAYSRAFRQGQLYHLFGKELEVNYVAIKELDGLGETRGLTPDYRWKVSRGLKLYDEVLKDFREMRVAFQDQLRSEVAYLGCDPQELIARGDQIDPSAPGTKQGDATTSATASVVPSGRKERPGKDTLGAPIPASMATFFVDNSSCPSSLRVYLDGALVGDVTGTAKAAFRALVGRHELCLIPATSPAQCGDPGTLRKTYVHDGFSITLRCD
jgi:hypothetical protein